MGDPRTQSLFIMLENGHRKKKKFQRCGLEFRFRSHQLKPKQKEFKVISHRVARGEEIKGQVVMEIDIMYLWRLISCTKSFFYDS